VRDRYIVVVCVIGVLSVFAGILFFSHSSAGDGGDAINRGPGRAEAAAITLGGPFFNQLFERDAPDASQGVTSATSSARSSAAGAGAGARSSGSGGGPSVARFAPAPQPARVCVPSLLGAVLGLLGSVLGGGSGC
jgi:hypothetical protein